mgnify:CR=1 FL=1
MKKREYDFWLLFTVLVLLGMGTVMVFSASSYNALYYHNNKFYFFIRQLIWSALGIAGMLVFSKLDYRRIASSAPILMVISIVLLILVRIPGIGSNINGAYRWFNFGPMSFQPSELAKISLILFLAFSLSKNADRLKHFFTGLVPYLLVVGVIDGLLYLEPHMSAIILITAVAVIILFMAGARVSHFVLLALPVVVLGWQIVMSKPYRMERLLSFTDPFKYKQGSGFQVVNSLYAIASGSVFGRGLGKSLQKYLYLPEPHNDFIFSILAEELGFVGSLTVVALFLLFIWRGMRVAMNAPDMLGSLIAGGITSLIALQTIINIAVVTSTVPATGMPLPFFSAGGSSLVFLMSSVGILLNISKGSQTTILTLHKGGKADPAVNHTLTKRKVGDY